MRRSLCRISDSGVGSGSFEQVVVQRLQKGTGRCVTFCTGSPIFSSELRTSSREPARSPVRSEPRDLASAGGGAGAPPRLSHENHDDMASYTVVDLAPGLLRTRGS